eukprot:g315.t1
MSGESEEEGMGDITQNPKSVGNGSATITPAIGGESSPSNGNAKWRSKAMMLGRLRQRPWLERHQHSVSNVAVLIFVVGVILFLSSVADPVPPAWMYFSKASAISSYPSSGKVGENTLIEFESIGAKSVCIVVGTNGNVPSVPPSCDSKGHRCEEKTLKVGEQMISYNTTVSYHREETGFPTKGVKCSAENKAVTSGDGEALKISSCESYKTNSLMILENNSMDMWNPSAHLHALIVRGSKGTATKVKAIGCHSSDNHSPVKDFTFTVAEEEWTGPSWDASALRFVPTFPAGNDATKKGFCISCVKSPGTPSRPICPDYTKSGTPVCGYAAEPGRKAIDGGVYNDGESSGSLGLVTNDGKNQNCKAIACLGGGTGYSTSGPANVHSAVTSFTFGP